MQVIFEPIVPRTDSRGIALALSRNALAFLGEIAELHYVTLLPGATRGNHRHRDRKEVLILQSDGAWRFRWEAPGHAARIRDFTDGEAIAILIPANVWHTLENIGETTLAAVSCSNGIPTSGDTEWRTSVG